MDEKKDGAAGVLKGGFTLFVGSFISLIVVAAGSILVARMMSPADYGLYGVTLVLPSFFLLFSDWGVDAALIRFIAKYRKQGKHELIWGLERGALLFKLGLGGILSLFLFLSADFLTAVLLKRPEVVGFVRLSSLLVLFQSVYTTIISGFSGLEKMNLRASINIIHALVKGGSSPILVYYGLGISGAVLGHMLGYAIASILGIFLLFTSTPHSRPVQTDVRSALDLMLGFGRPIFLASLATGATLRFQGFLLSWFVSDTAFGNYHVAHNFTVLIGLVTGSLAVTLFPVFSRLSHILEPEKVQEALRSSIKYSSTFIVPIIFLIGAVSEPMVSTLFAGSYPQVPLLLSLLLVPTLLICLGSFSLRSFLNSQGDTKMSLKIELIGSVTNILVAPILLWIFGIFGLAYSLIISSVFRSLFGLSVLKMKYNFYPDLQHSTRTIVSSVVSTGLTIGFIRYFSNIPSILSLILGTGTFILAYLIIAPVIGAVDANMIKYLDSKLRNIVVVYPIARIILRFEMKIIQILEKTKRN